MFLLPEDQHEALKAVFKQAFTQVVTALDTCPPAYPMIDEEEQVIYRVNDKRQRLPKRAGIYVIYSQRTNRAVYVGEGEQLKREIDHEYRETGMSEFKLRWVRQWLNMPLNRPISKIEHFTVTQFLLDQTYLKCIAVPFGRREIMEELRAMYKIRIGANAIDPQKEFEVE